ncbi:hypothetical protein CW748_11175 [Alteromonadales bacterium alter-6D02]|nr:hypothetical protein CW748_11175 [Alteromonadales bacterium alter-6D02]
MALQILLLCLSLGAVVGFLAGMLGIGGGLVIVPVLLALLPLAGVTDPVLMPMVLGTSLAAILLTSISTLLAHHRADNIPYHFVSVLIVGIGFGALVGGYSADLIPSEILKLFFACFVLLMSLQMWVGSKNNQQDLSTDVKPAKVQLSVVSVFIGGIASLLGIGGGVLLVPYLTSVVKLDMRKAIGASAAGGFFVALMGSMGYLWAGLHTDAVLPKWSLGYIYLPALVGIISVSLFTAPLGVKVAKRLPIKVLKRCFAVLLFVVGTKILIG